MSAKTPQQHAASDARAGSAGDVAVLGASESEAVNLAESAREAEEFAAATGEPESPSAASAANAAIDQRSLPLRWASHFVNCAVIAPRHQVG